MEQRISLITLGVADLGRARRFYETLGWKSDSKPDQDVVFFQAGGLVVGLWGRDQLAEDSGVEDQGGFGGITLAYNVGAPEEVDATLAEAERAGGRQDRTPWCSHVLGRLFRCLPRPRRSPVGGRAQPVLDPARGRLDQPLTQLSIEPTRLANELATDSSRLVEEREDVVVRRPEVDEAGA